MWMWNPNLAGKWGLNPLEIKFIKENLGADLKTVGVVMKVFKLYATLSSDEFKNFLDKKKLLCIY